MNLQVHKQTVLLLDDCPDLPEDVVDIKVGSNWNYNKPGIHFPVEMFPSALWVKICLMTEQEVNIILFCLFKVQQYLFNQILPRTLWISVTRLKLLVV